MRYIISIIFFCMSAACVYAFANDREEFSLITAVAVARYGTPGEYEYVVNIGDDQLHRGRGIAGAQDGTPVFEPNQTVVSILEPDDPNYQNNRTFTLIVAIVTGILSILSFIHFYTTRNEPVKQDFWG